MTDRETGRSRGFGFVEMPDNRAAQTAIDALNGTSLAGRVGKPSSAVAAYHDGAPLVSAQLCPGTVFAGTLLCRVCHASPRTPGMGVHDNAVPPCLALGVGHDVQSSLIVRSRRL